MDKFLTISKKKEGDKAPDAAFAIPKECDMIDLDDKDLITALNDDTQTTHSGSANANEIMIDDKAL
jgi:hypothetical protein